MNEGKAILSLRYWTGSPYNGQKDGSTQGVFLELGKGECGIQKILFDDYFYSCLIDDKRFGDMWKLYKNDGLSSDDFQEWFKDYDLQEPMAIIHLTTKQY